MRSLSWGKFFWQDYESDPALRMCSYAAQGLWMRMLCIAARHDPIGYVAVEGRGLDETDIARLTGGTVPEVSALLADLDRNGVFSRDGKGRIYSRRMIRDQKKASIAKKNGKMGGNPSLSNKRGNPASDKEGVKPPDKGGVKPKRLEARNQTNTTTNVSPETARARSPDVSEHLAKVCNAAGMVRPPGDMRRLAEWIAAGADVDRDVLPVVERITESLKRRNDRPSTFKLFEPDVLAAVHVRQAEDEEWMRKTAEIEKRYPGPSMDAPIGGYDEPVTEAA